MTRQITREQVMEAAAAARNKGERLDLSGRDLSRLDLSYVNLTGADLTRAYLFGADLRHANLPDADLSHANLSDANLAEAVLARANLDCARLIDANLDDANLGDANLTSAKLIGASLRGAYLHGAILTRVNLHGADLRDVAITGLFLDGLPSGDLAFLPTPGGWQLTIGCWKGTTHTLREMTAKDDDWPEAEGEQIIVRRPMLNVAATMCDVFAAAHPNAVAEARAAAERWKETP